MTTYLTILGVGLVINTLSYIITGDPFMIRVS